VTPSFVSEALTRVNQKVGSGIEGSQAGDQSVLFDAMTLHMIEAFPGAGALLASHGSLGGRGVTKIH
jgi:hypothetical protein